LAGITQPHTSLAHVRSAARESSSKAEWFILVPPAFNTTQFS
jgi:hypothetical protein